MQRLQTHRECGRCQACCVAPRLDERDKPAYTRCRDLVRSGCRNYKSRPDPCRQYKCLWLQGWGAKDDRPDKTGAMFTARDHAEHGPWVSLHVVGRKALTTRRVRKAVVGLIQKTVVIEMQSESMRMLGGPAERVDAFNSVALSEQVPLHRDDVVVPASALKRRRA